MKINSIDSSNERLVDNGKDFFRSKIDDIGNKNTVGGGREKYSAGILGMDLRTSPDVGGGFRSVRVSTGERQSRTRFKGAASRPGAGVEGLR